MKRLFYDLKSDLAMILAGARSAEALKRAAADRCNALSELLGLDLMVDTVRDEQELQANYERLLNSQFKLSRAEAASIIDKAMDERYQEIRKQGQRIAGSKNRSDLSR